MQTRYQMIWRGAEEELRNYMVSHIHFTERRLRPREFTSNLSKIMQIIKHRSSLNSSFLFPSTIFFTQIETDAICINNAYCRRKQK